MPQRGGGTADRPGFRSRGGGTPELFDGPGVQRRVLGMYERAFKEFEGGVCLHRVNGELPAQQLSAEIVASLGKRLPILGA